MNVLVWPIVIPLAGGLLALITPRALKGLRELIALLATGITIYYAAGLFAGSSGGTTLSLAYPWLTVENFVLSLDLRVDVLSRFIVLAASVFGFLIVFYSVGFMRGKERIREYYAYILWTVAACNAALMADNLLLLLISWEVVTLLLFFLITIAGEGSPPAAGKTFVMIGAADCAMLLAVALIWRVLGTLKVSELNHVPMETGMTHLIYALLLAGAVAKAGAIPGHSWIPKAAEIAPTSVMAFLPAALDKLLGIYLLARMSLFMFAPSEAMKLTLLIIGAFTIILAVMAALVQHEFKKLLACHAVSQVGYMMMGIGTGVPIGIVGGLFHMVNNAIYKCCLFLGAGAVERRAGTTELEKLGGLAAAMPVTFGACLISALAISGVPPLNGFASKWLVYQGVLQVGRPVFVVAAMFGSALTLASFIKVIYSVFLGKRPETLRSVKGAGYWMAAPMVVLALLCILFGVFAQVPVNQFVGPAAGLKTAALPEALRFPAGLWDPTLATGLILIGLVIGIIIYLFGTVTKVRTTSIFTGGEILEPEEERVPGTGFYETVTSMPGLGGIYRDAEQGVYDLYVLGGRYGQKIVDVFRAMHTGIVSTYVALCIAGLGIILFLLLR